MKCSLPITLLRRSAGKPRSTAGRCGTLSCGPLETIREHRGVACRYIDPPFLVDGLKSDLDLCLENSEVPKPADDQAPFSPDFTMC